MRSSLRPNHALASEASARSPTGLDRDRLSGRGDQGYGRAYGGHYGRGPRGYRRADERILDDVCSRLTEDDYVDATEVTVRVDDGEVTLAGRVETRPQKRRAEALALGVLGVLEVNNRLRVVPAS